MIEKYLIESEMEYVQKIEELEQEIEKYKQYIKRKEEENERIKRQEIPGEELLSPLIKKQDNYDIFHGIQKYTEAIEELHKKIELYQQKLEKVREVIHLYRLKRKDDQKIKVDNQKILHLLYQEKSMISEKVDKQLVFGLKDASGRLKYVKKLMDVDREKAKRELVEAEKDIYLQIDKVQGIISDLKDYRCYGNLKNNIQSLLNRLRRNTYIEIKLLFKQGLYEYQPEEQMIILDIIEESCKNAIVHSHTKDIVVGVRKEEKLEFYIKDRGVGFNVEGVTASGIDSMKLKCDLINGEFTITSKPGEGTTILVRI